MTINPLTDERFQTDLFSDDDRQFMATFFLAHPHVGENFDRYLSLPAIMRPRMAIQDVAKIPRKGWVNHGIEKPETVYDHMQGLSDMVREHFTGRGRISPKQLLSESEVMHVCDMASVHDMIEAIASDFTPQDTTEKGGAGKITAEDKERIEQLAGRVIYASPENERQLALIQEYGAQETEPSHLLHDLDKLHAVRHAAYYEATQPGQFGLFREFHDYAARKMKTEDGRALCADMAAEQHFYVAKLIELQAAPVKHSWSIRI